MEIQYPNMEDNKSEWISNCLTELTTEFGEDANQICAILYSQTLNTISDMSIEHRINKISDFLKTQ
jgi:hypothetical protein